MIIFGQNADLDQILSIARGDPVWVGDRMVKG
jgi:threonine dehydratase